MSSNFKSSDLLVLKDEIDERIKEINKMSDFLEKIENEKEEVLIINSIKSSLVIMLYNVIEYFIIELVKIIEDDFKKNKYNDFTDEFKSIFLSSFVKHFWNIKNETVLSYLKDRKDGFDDFFNLESLALYWYSKLEISTKCRIKNTTKKNNWKWISWNIDYETIETISNFFWFDLNIRNNNDKDFLKKIKEIRNELSHWDKWFNDYWKDLVLNDLKDYKNKLLKIIEKFLKEIDDYLIKKPYLIKNETLKN